MDFGYDVVNYELVTDDPNTLSLQHFDGDYTDSSSYNRIFYSENRSSQYVDSGSFGQAVKLSSGSAAGVTIPDLSSYDSLTFDFRVYYADISFIYRRKGMTASQALEARRSHWTIENQLHWVPDMQFREECSARADNSAEKLNVLRQWAYNLLRSETSVRGSFSDRQFKCLLDEAFLDKIVRSSFCSYLVFSFNYPGIINFCS